MDELQERQLAPDVFTFNALIKVLVAAGDFATASRLVAGMEVRPAANERTIHKRHA